MSRGRLAMFGAALFTLVASACGSDSTTNPPSSIPADGAPHAVEVVMTDLKYDTTNVTVAKGATVEFTFVNHGKVPHDAFIGDQAAQDAHETEMAGMPAGHEHDMGAQGVTVQPGSSAVLTYTFDSAGTVQVACHQHGHYAAGMHLDIDVV